MVLLILLVLLRLPVLLGGMPVLQTELDWMLVGESLSAGDTLYQDVWTHLSPLSAGVYWVLDELFGRSLLTYRLLAILLLTIQATIFNVSLLNFKVFNENSYVPALLYAFLGSFFFDAYTLSPVLLSLTFLLLAHRNLIRMIAAGAADETLFYLGLHVGLAVLCWLPAFVLMFAYLFALLIFTGTKPRQYLLLLIGALLPPLSAGLYYSWNKAFGYFYAQYIGSLSLFGGTAVSVLSLAAITLVPAALLLLGIFRYLNARGFNNYQVRVQQTFFYTLLMGLLAFFLVTERSAFHLLIVLPVSAYYIAYYFMAFRHAFIAELVFLGVMLLQIGFSYSLLYKWFPEVEPYVVVEDLYTRERPENSLVEGRRILTLGPDLSLYRQARLATPYLEWRYAEDYLTDMQYYDNLLAVYQTFQAELPDVLVDDAGVLTELFARMPTVASRYKASNEFPHVYLLQEPATANN